MCVFGRFLAFAEPKGKRPHDAYHRMFPKSRLFLHDRSEAYACRGDWRFCRSLKAGGRHGNDKRTTISIYKLDVQTAICFS